MLLRDASQVKSNTFDAIFKFDIDKQKCRAASDLFRNDEQLQGEVRDRMNAELD